MDVSILTFKEKDKLVRYIYKLYQKANLDLREMNGFYNPYPSSSFLQIKESSTPYRVDKHLLKRIERKRELEMFIVMMDDVFEHMSDKSVMIFKNDYYSSYVKDWWVGQYSRATYYRLKNIAFEEFFRYFDESFMIR